MTRMLRARLFGGLAVEVDGRAVADVPGMKPRALLAYLLSRPEPVSRARVGRGLLARRPGHQRARLPAQRPVERAGGARGRRRGRLPGRRSRERGPGAGPAAVDRRRGGRAAARGRRPRLAGAGGRARGAPVPPRDRRRVGDRGAGRLARPPRRGARPAGRARRGRRGRAGGDRVDAPGAPPRPAARGRPPRPHPPPGRRRRARPGHGRLPPLPGRAVRRARDPSLGRDPRARRRAAHRRRPGPAPAAAPPPPAPAPPPPARPPLRGRDAELAVLRAALEAAMGGRGGVAAVAGVAGIGKSRLAAEVVDQAAQAGARTASGAALDLESGPPYAAWSEALRGLVRATPAPPAEARWPADLALLCPAVESAWGREAAAAATPDLERLRIFDAVVEAIAWSAQGAPTVVLLEDLHRADPASLALLGHVGRRLGDLRALVVVTRRPAADGEVERALEAVRRGDGALAEVALGPLGPEAIAAIVADAASGLGGEGAARVAGAAQGNPLIARETARAAAAGLPPEEGLRGSVRSSLTGLPGVGRDLVALAAAAGRPLSPGEAVEILGPEPAAHARDAAAEAGLLVPRGDGRLAFSHDLVGRACAAELAPERLGWAHQRLADTLAGRPAGRAAEVARHLRLGGRGPRAVPYLAAAAAEARRLGALDEAAGFLAEGIALAPPPDAEAELWLGLADVHAWRGDREALDAAFARARALLEAGGDPAALAAAWAARGRWLRTSICYPRESLEAYRTALGLLDGGVDAPEVEVLARAGSAWAESVAGDPERAEADIAALEAAARRRARSGAGRRAGPRPHHGHDPGRAAGRGRRAGPAGDRAGPGGGAARAGVGGVQQHRGRGRRARRLRALPRARRARGARRARRPRARRPRPRRPGALPLAPRPPRRGRRRRPRAGGARLARRGGGPRGHRRLRPRVRPARRGRAAGGRRAPRGRPRVRRRPLLAPARPPAAGAGARGRRRPRRGRGGGRALPVRARGTRRPARDAAGAPAAHAGPRGHGPRRARARPAPPGRGGAGLAPAAGVRARGRRVRRRGRRPRPAARWPGWSSPPWSSA